MRGQKASLCIQIAGERMIAGSGYVARDRIEGFILAREPIGRARINERAFGARELAGREDPRHVGG